MRKTTPRLRVPTQTPKIEVVQRRLHGLVHRRPQTLRLQAIGAVAGVTALEIGVGGCVPGDAEAVDVVEAVAGGGEVVGVVEVGGVMGDELGKVVVVDLVGEGVGGGYEGVFEEGGLGGGEVGEPAWLVLLVS